MVTSKDSMICAVWDLDKAGERCHPVDTSASMRSPRFRLVVTPRSLPFVRTLIGPTLSWRQAGYGVEAACAGPFPTGVGTLPPKSTGGAMERPGRRPSLAETDRLGPGWVTVPAAPGREPDDQALAAATALEAGILAW